VTGWLIYTGSREPHDDIGRLPDPPRWRSFSGPASLAPPPPEEEDVAARRLGATARAAAYRPSAKEVEMVNAALYLRRPLLVTGKPGTGKSTLAHSVARELKLGPVLTWTITSRSARQEGLYQYDALARLHDVSLARESGQDGQLGIGRYIRLGPLGTAMLPYQVPRVLLIDELDKSDIDLPSDLLTIFEEGEYEIPELLRIAAEQPRASVRTYDASGAVEITGGRVRCHAFPLVIITSNGERDFPPAFLRRCLRLELEQPTHEQLTAIVGAHLGIEEAERSEDLIATFVSRRTTADLATDQLLNAIYLRYHQAWPGDKERLVTSVLQYLNAGDTE
jgi:MoxR-like ATPase